jgi:cyclohexyl-isocyanide hydratase
VIFIGPLRTILTFDPDILRPRCTGSLLIAAAGLLRGRRAACHWAWRELLAEFGVTPDAGRVVRHGNVITGGGVTAGIDMTLSVMAGSAA